jgi:hypothetical protein
LPGGTGEVVDISSLNSQLDFLKLVNNVTESVTSFNSTLINSLVDDAWAITYQLVADYNSYKVVDFDTSLSNDFQVLTDISNPASCPDLTAADDSWIPAKGSFIPCQSRSKYTPTFDECFSPIPFPFDDRTSSCKGCL